MLIKLEKPHFEPTLRYKKQKNSWYQNFLNTEKPHFGPILSKSKFFFQINPAPSLFKFDETLNKCKNSKEYKSSSEEKLWKNPWNPKKQKNSISKGPHFLGSRNEKDVLTYLMFRYFWKHESILCHRWILHKGGNLCQVNSKNALHSSYMHIKNKTCG